MKSRLQMSLFALTMRQFKDYLPWYLAATLALFGTHWIQSYLPFLAKELAEMVETGSGQIATAKFFWLAIGIVVFRSASRILFFYPARVMQKLMRVELLEKLEKASPLRYRHNNDGQIFQVCGNDMEQVRALFGFAYMQIANIIIALAVLTPKIIAFNPKLVIALSPMAIAFIIFTVVVSRNSHLYKEMMDVQGEVQNFIMESYNGKKTIKNFHAESSFIQLFDSHSAKELGLFFKASTRIAYSMPLIPLGVGLALIFGAHIVFQEQLGASSLVLFSGFVFLFVEPLAFVSWIGVVIARTVGSWARVRGFVADLVKESEQEKIMAKKNPLPINGECYNFDLEFWSRDLKLKMEPGKWTVLIGRTGCGKTHLIQQMADTLKLHGARISYVAQDPYLYNDSIEANLFLGQEPGVDRKNRAWELLQLFGLDYLAANREELFVMEVGENGKKLSGGQAKRLSLVRSLLSDGEILIWDDPFSSVDLILEKQIIEKLRQLPEMRERTVILSSHRLTTVRKSDHVYYLEKEEGVLEEGAVNILLNGESKTNEYFAKQMV